jgi:anti-anti-sigma factor
MSTFPNSCSSDIVDKQLTFKISGQLDLYVAKSYIDRILADVEREAPQSLVVDLIKTEYIDSPGLAFLLLLYKTQAAGGSIRLIVREGSQAARLLNISRFHNIFPIEYEAVGT